jgi:hypothetical protein
MIQEIKLTLLSKWSSADLSFAIFFCFATLNQAMLGSRQQYVSANSTLCVVSLFM